MSMIVAERHVKFISLIRNTFLESQMRSPGMCGGDR